MSVGCYSIIIKPFFPQKVQLPSQILWCIADSGIQVSLRVACMCLRIKPKPQKRVQEGNCFKESTEPIHPFYLFGHSSLLAVVHMGMSVS